MKWTKTDKICGEAWKSVGTILFSRVGIAKKLSIQQACQSPLRRGVCTLPIRWSTKMGSRPSEATWSIL
jgi:hypothetical protein